MFQLPVNDSVPRHNVQWYNVNLLPNRREEFELSSYATSERKGENVSRIHRRDLASESYKRAHGNRKLKGRFFFFTNRTNKEIREEFLFRSKNRRKIRRFFFIDRTSKLARGDFSRLLRVRHKKKILLYQSNEQRGKRASFYSRHCHSATAAAHTV